MKLSATKVKNAKAAEKPYKLTDGDGMHLLVRPLKDKYKGASKLWRFDYRFNGVRKTLALGRYPDVSLESARNRRTEARRLLADDIDPAESKKRARQAQCIENTFEAVARSWHVAKKAGWAEDTASGKMRRLERDLFPHLGERPIAEIEPPELLKVLRRIEARGAVDIAKKSKIVVGQIFRYAIAEGKAKRDITQDIRDALKTRKVKHHAAITKPSEIAALLRVIEGYSGDVVTRMALSLAPHVFVRPGELRHAEWSEIDLEGNQSFSIVDSPAWVIPAEKMKMDSPHIVPLSTQAVSILRELHPITGHGRYVFPGVRSAARPMSENTVNAALRRCGYTSDEMTGHGFRSMASTRLYESNKWPGDVIELQLAHMERNNVKAAYNYAQHLPVRVEMMQWWSEYIERLKSGATVLQLAASASK